MLPDYNGARKAPQMSCSLSLRNVPVAMLKFEVKQGLSMVPTAPDR
jgi:hypothetical protein